MLNQYGILSYDDDDSSADDSSAAQLDGSRTWPPLGVTLSLQPAKDDGFKSGPYIST